ncbi:hypothetical protein [Pedobacter immunditicola]
MNILIIPWHPKVMQFEVTPVLIGVLSGRDLLEKAKSLILND